MTRQQELEEVAGMINSLCKKYNVALSVQIVDLSLTETKMSDETQAAEAEVVAPAQTEAPVEAPAQAE